MPDDPAAQASAAINRHDAEAILTAPLRDPSAPVPFAATLDTQAKNTFGKTLFIIYRVGVISAPGQNGHIYGEVAPDVGGSPGTWVSMGYIACRNETGNTSPIGNGGALTLMVPAGYWYRTRTFTVGGFATPTFLLDGITVSGSQKHAVFQTIG